MDGQRRFLDGPHLDQPNKAATIVRHYLVDRYFLPLRTVFPSPAPPPPAPTPTPTPGQQQQLQQQQQQLPAGGQDDAETARRQRKLLLRAEADAEVARRAFHSLIQLLEALDRPSSSWLTVQALRGQLLRPQPPVLTSEPPSSSSSIQWGASSSPPRAHTAPAGKQRSTHTGERAACSDSWPGGKCWTRAGTSVLSGKGRGRRRRCSCRRCGKLSGCWGGRRGAARWVCGRASRWSLWCRSARRSGPGIRCGRRFRTGCIRRRRSDRASSGGRRRCAPRDRVMEAGGRGTEGGGGCYERGRGRRRRRLWRRWLWRRWLAEVRCGLRRPVYRTKYDRVVVIIIVVVVVVVFILS
ncbi:hypothetical protein PLESTB_000070600 [Pleodorina starrii]|uniref:Uncharacterized protein n=1 Tax=Pleodorina starrii TaxID=330485 RepID=A0A9W6B9U5_9CHLO|nr:hypothetical protein PLESTB_000070600 [Pleodorina starrii]